MRRLFRAMREATDGFPELGRSARLLGVRPGDQTSPDVPAIDPVDVVVPGDGGMSVASDDAGHLPRHRRPASLGGTGADPVWALDIADLPPELAARQDSRTHAVIEPAAPTTLTEFEIALAGTRLKWKLFAR